MRDWAKEENTKEESMNEKRKGYKILIEKKYESALRSLIKKMREPTDDELGIIVVTAKEMEAAKNVHYVRCTKVKKA